MSSPINKKILEHLAALARIELTKKEEEKFLKELEIILEHFEELKLIDTAKVLPMSGGTINRNVFREDEEREGTNRGRGVVSFPDQKDGFLKIPKIF